MRPSQAASQPLTRAERLRRAKLIEELGAAIKARSPADIQAAIMAGADPAAPLSWGPGEQERPLQAALAMGDPACVARLTALGAPVDIDAMRRAASLGEPACLAILIEAGGPLDNASDPRGSTPLERAAGAGRLANVEALLAAGADPDGHNPSHGLGALMEAVIHTKFGRLPGSRPESDWTDCIRALLATGAAPARPDFNGATAVSLALQYDLDEGLRALLDAGGDVDAATGLSAIPAFWRCFESDSATALRIAIERGADLAWRLGERSCLDKAAERGAKACCEILVAHGLDPLAKDASGDDLAAQARKSKQPAFKKLAPFIEGELGALREACQIRRQIRPASPAGGPKRRI